MRFLLRAFISWLPLAVLITGACALVYATVQQNYRQSLNDPQIQMAEDGAHLLAQTKTPAAVVPRDSMIDISESLAPWLAVYDENGTPLESSAVLDGAPPKPPAGVFAYTKGDLGDIIDVRRVPLEEKVTNENRLSWQPRPDVRSAIVVVWVPETKQFVVAGRSMREVEGGEDRLSFMVFIAWLVLLVATFVAEAFARYLLD